MSLRCRYIYIYIYIFRGISRRTMFTPGENLTKGILPRIYYGIYSEWGSIDFIVKLSDALQACKGQFTTSAHILCTLLNYGGISM